MAIFKQSSASSGTARQRQEPRPRDSGDDGLRGSLDEGPYELVHWIGAGGMAQVWLARRSIYGTVQQVAIKMISDRHHGNPEYERLFQREAKLSMSLNHSNIVQAHDLCRVDGRMGLVMEWVEGINLGRLLQHLRQCEQLLPLDLAAFILGEVLAGLTHAHAQRGRGAEPIVHCDITPQNVLLSFNGEVKMADYGVAETDSERAGTEVRGTLRYMAPEQAAGQPRGPEVDLYAVGAILHEMLVGRRFRDAIVGEDMLAAVIAGAPPPLGRAACPELSGLCRGLLAPKLEDRVRSASEAMALLLASRRHRDCRLELAALLAAVAETSSEDPSMVSMTPMQTTHTQTWVDERMGTGAPPRRWGRWLGAVGVGLLLLVGRQAWVRPAAPVMVARGLVIEAANPIKTRGVAEPATIHIPPSAWTVPGRGPGLGESLTIDGRPIADPTAPIRLDPGVHTIQVEVPGEDWSAGLLELEAGTDYQVELSAELPARPFRERLDPVETRPRSR